MLKIEVDAYDCRHPEHEKFLDFQCDTGLDITLHPGFIVEINVADSFEMLPPHVSIGSYHGDNPEQQAQMAETRFLTTGADQPPPGVLS